MKEKIIKFINYVATSLASSVVDLAFFYVFLDIVKKLRISPDVFFATIGARLISSVVSYILNRRYVFKSDGDLKIQFNKHVVIEGVQMFLSASLVTMLDFLINKNEIIEKCAVDLFLFFVAYFAQKHWVYKQNY